MSHLNNDSLSESHSPEIDRLFSSAIRKLENRTKKIHGPKPVDPGPSGSVLVLGELDRTRTNKILKISDQNLAVRGSLVRHRYS